MSTYRVTFDRIGRNHNVKPLTVEVDGPDHLASEIYHYAKPHLLSGFPDVVVDLEAGRGSILCGFNNGGTFTVEPVSGGGS
jgi:hypothetical protein